MPLCHAQDPESEHLKAMGFSGLWVKGLRLGLLNRKPLNPKPLTLTFEGFGLGWPLKPIEKYYIVSRVPYSSH